MNAKQKQLWDAIWASHFYPGSASKPAVTVEIDGHQFTAQHIVVNRKCYDSLATPTLIIKVDGKRIARKAAYELLA